jgi:AcrR family transcriptional regulator
MPSTAREAIIDAAVRHFAEHGYGGASLREILRDAGVNTAAAHYHFGSKEAVYREAVSRYLNRLCEERRIALLAIEADLDPQERLERLIRAYIEPHLRLCREPAAHDYVRLMARFITEDNELTRRTYTEILEPVRSLYLAAFAKVAPHLSREELRRLFSFMVVLMVTAPADSSYQSMTGLTAWPEHPDKLLDQLVAFVSAGFAPRSRPARARVNGSTTPRRKARARSTPRS